MIRTKNEMRVLESVEEYISTLRNSLDLTNYFINYSTKFMNGTPDSIGKLKTTTHYRTNGNKYDFTFYFYKDYMEQNIEHYCNSIVPHEVAHMFTRIHYGKVQPHGLQFRYICSLLTDSDVVNQTTCDIEYIQSNKTTKKLYNYKCSICGEIIQLSKIRHNKVMRGTATYSHTTDGGLLKFVKGE